MKLSLSLLLLHYVRSQLILQHENQLLPVDLNDGSIKVAIIGAGASGSSSAYFLDFLQQKFSSVRVSVSLYESSNYIGGRSTTLNLPNSTAYVELGASIFVDVNKNLMHATKVFDLQLYDTSPQSWY